MHSDAPSEVVFAESHCLRVQCKLGDEFLLKLNIRWRPIANKYREGKLQRTLKRELEEPETTNGEGFGCAIAVRILEFWVDICGDSEGDFLSSLFQLFIHSSAFTYTEVH